MPRMQPPKGYIRSKEVQGILNVSPAMIREYVMKGKIKHLVPSGRTQGFYLESDVKRLANELDVFLNLEEEADIVSFGPVTKKDLFACFDLNRELFNVSSSESNETLFEKWEKLIQKNPEIVYILKKNDDVVGIITMLPFKPKSKKFEEILVGDISILLGDVDISTEDIEEYKAGKHIQLYLAEIGTKPSLEKNLRRIYGAKLIARFMDEVVNLGKRGIVIEKMTAVGATKSGIRLLQHFGFSEVIFPREDTRFFTINMKESGAPIIRDYRKALQNHLKELEIIS